MSKGFIKKEFVIPIICALVATAISLSALVAFVNRQYIAKNTITLSEYSVADAKPVEANSEMPKELLSPDTAIGSMSVGDTELSLVFSPDYADTKDNFFQLDNGVLIGDIGNAVVCCSK